MTFTARCSSMSSLVVGDVTLGVYWSNLHSFSSKLISTTLCSRGCHASSSSHPPEVKLVRDNCHVLSCLTQCRPAGPGRNSTSYTLVVRWHSSRALSLCSATMSLVDRSACSLSWWRRSSMLFHASSTRFEAPGIVSRSSAAAPCQANHHKLANGLIVALHLQLALLP